MRISVIILAGGSGTRLWPLSRNSLPKQFLRLNSKNSLFQETLERVNSLEIESFTTVCNIEHRFIVEDQFRDVGYEHNIILEPLGRNTAPAIALASLLANKDSILLVLPADHYIENESSFVNSIQNSIHLAEQGKLVTFGINPYEANTNYGYIKAGETYGENYIVDSFTEKPDLLTAKKYLQTKKYFWNSGIFLFKADSILKEFEAHNLKMMELCKTALDKSEKDGQQIKVHESDYKNIQNISFDYAVMENTKNSVVVPLDTDWNDLGTWDSLWKLKDKDKDGNYIEGDVIAKNTRNSFVQSDHKLVTVLGIEDLVIVSSNDSILISDKKEVHKINEITDELKIQAREELVNPRIVYRPWGNFESLDISSNFQVKRLTVNPGEKLSLQKHIHRAEHWVVVSGIALVTKGDETFTLNVNESTYIPKESIHSLENPGEEVLEIIEVQTGSYLGEDDIIRLEDIYGRTS